MVAVNPDYLAVADAVRRGDRPAALSLAARALKRGVDHPLVVVLAAEGLEERGRLGPATDLLRGVTRAAPRHRVAWMRLAALLARQRLFTEAADAFDKVLTIDPHAFDALIGAGEMKLLLRDPEGAERCYLRAMEVAPNSPAPPAILAVMAAQQRKVGKARELAARAAALAPGILGAEMALARADLIDGAPDLTVARLTALLTRTDIDDENRAGVFDIRAEAFDAQGRADEAFADYEARNALLLRVNAPSFGGDSAMRPPDHARGLAAFVAAAPADVWRAPRVAGPPTDKPARQHVFLLGFPRSGTTLLEKVLAGHPDAVTLEEINHLAAVALELRGNDAGWRRLADLSGPKAEACRTRYWDLVSKSLDGGISDKIVVDKLPLHTLDLPVIAKLFPDAKILFALRDPRDVVLSCYRRRFQVNVAMFEFLTLDGAAQFYDATMSLAAVSRARLRLDIRDVRHESVIADFDGEIAEILGFIGADWDPAVRNFSERVGGHMRTPSYSQLARGLNADGVGQWRRYERHMAPILDTLAPWVARFGYPPSSAGG